MSTPGTIEQLLAPPVNDPNPAPPPAGELVTPRIQFLNMGNRARLAAAFAGTANPTAVWQQMIDDSPQAFSYYRELEEKDDDVGSAIAEMKLSVTGRDLQVLPGDDSQLALDAATFIQAQLDGLPDFGNSFDAILDAPFYGYSISEMIFDLSSGQVALLDIRDRPQELFCFAPMSYPQIGKLRLKEYYGAYDGTLVPEQKFITFTSRSRAGNRMGRALLRSVYWPSWFKRNVQTFWMRLAERGPGTAVVKHAQGASDSEKQEALAAAEALVESIAMAVPENFEVMEELLKGARSADPATYEKLYGMLESKIYRRIVGSTLTSHGSDGGKGTQALGNVHAAAKDQRSVELTMQVDAVLNRQLVRPLTLWNFGPACPMPKLQHDISNEEDLGKLITVYDTAQQMGLPIGKKHFYSRFGIDTPEKNEETLDRPQAPAPPIATPAGPPDRPQFAAGAPQFSAEREAQVQQEITAFDTLFAQFKGESQKEYRDRIKQVADAALKTNVRPGHL